MSASLPPGLTLFTGHERQASAPAASWYVLGSHGVQTVAAAPEYDPGAHAVHVSLPAPALTVPAAHAKQSRPDGVYPGSHVHAVALLPALASAPHASHAVAPSALEYVSAPQLVQVVVLARWCVPAAQIVHAPASPAYPGSHTQLCTLVEPRLRASAVLGTRLARQ